MPSLPRWAWVLVAVVFAGIAAYVGMSMISKQRSVTIKSAPAPAPAPAEERQTQPGSKRFGGGVIRHGDPGDSGEAK